MEEKEDIVEEEKVANLPWLIDLTSMDTVQESDRPTQENINPIGSGVSFNFEDGCSLKSTRLTPSKQDKKTSITTPPRSRSILKSSSLFSRSTEDSTVTSYITTDTRLQALEVNMGTLGGTMGHVISLIEDIKATNLNSSTTNELTVHKDGQPKV